MTASDTHDELEEAWTLARPLLTSMRSRIQFANDTTYMEILDKADRVNSLGHYLDGAVALMREQAYEPAFALLRSTLEHMVVDWLVFQGNVLVRRFTNVTDETWAKWQAARERGDEWTQPIRHWHRTRRGDVRINFEGLFSEPDQNGRRRQISVYYFLLDQFRPALGPPSAQVDDDGLASLDELRRMARENQDLWHTYLRWASLVENLRANDLTDEADSGRLEVHYRFLSGFAHPVSDLRDEVYGKNVGSGWPTVDHFSSELILLYVLTLAASEAHHFADSLHDSSDATIARSDDLLRDLDAVEAAASHFWFLGINPHAYDYWVARNQLAFRRLRDSDRDQSLDGGAPPILDASDIPYPRDPLRRLVALHRSTREMLTGLTYDSPWPRSDAQFR